ncbi:nuclear pore complex assembly-domain-containing protein [Xylariales sp. PMI_506]|nr:nuclear pore complex assembly-domain-containing protein [Xylariales sp. PMI_506]
MIDYSSFDRVFGALSPFPYNRNFIQEAEAHRRNFDGALFIDRVLAALGHSKARSHYPPKSDAALRQLHEQIINSNTIATHHKLSVLYYLLLDIDDLSTANQKSSSALSAKAESFAARSGLPAKYQIFIKGLWYMDRYEFSLALEFLAHPSLLPEFADDIIIVLVKHASKDGDYTLPLAYWHTVQPVLKNPTAVELLFEALSRSNVSAALQFSRSKPEGTREKLFQRMILSVLGNDRSEDSADRAAELASLSLDSTEEAWFNEILSSGEGKRLKVARDTLLVRRIALGESTPTGGEKGTWGVVMEAFKVGSGGRT